ncbi:MAG: glucose-1-phosphate thymidylyltransferase [Candidatus Bipolaricaulota bacterium]|nr:glucose-1-phosphate thymidylyltransferase [Candidatus Bipolaricaulota bacterium]
MKAVVLCGGEGTRLRPFTHTQAKHLLPVAGRPVVEHALEAVREAGITDVVVVVSPGVERQFRERLGDGARLGLRLAYALQPEPKGLAHAVLCAEELLGDEPFLVYLGDNLLERGVAGVVDLFRRERPEAVVSLQRVPDPRRFGVAVVEGRRLVRLVEKPREPPSDLAIVGAYAFTPLLFRAAREIRPSFRGELELTDCLQWLLDRGHTVLPHLVEGWWQDVGRPGDLLVANRLLLARLSPRVEGEVDGSSRVEGSVVVEAGARVVGSRLVGPVWIGAGGTVERAVIGPHVAVGPGAEVRGAHVEDAILMDGARVEGGTLRVSVVGRRAEIRQGSTAYPISAFLGDDSVLGPKEDR